MQIEEFSSLDHDDDKLLESDFKHSLFLCKKIIELYDGTLQFFPIKRNGVIIFQFSMKLKMSKLETELE